MKKFRVHFKENKPLVVQAERFDVNGTYGLITFFKEGETGDKDLYIRYDHVIAIVPADDDKEPEAPSSSSSQTY